MKEINENNENMQSTSISNKWGWVKGLEGRVQLAQSKGDEILL